METLQKLYKNPGVMTTKDDYTLEIMRITGIVHRWKNLSIFRMRHDRLISGYSNFQLLETVILKNKLRQKKFDVEQTMSVGEFQAVALLNYVYKGEPLNIIDFGGGTGSHFYFCEKIHPEKIAKWTVVETPKMVEISEKEFLHPKLRFVSDLKIIDIDAEQPDLVFSSSSLQYTENPLATLREILELGAQNLILTRTPLAESRNQVKGDQISKLSSNGPGPLPMGIQDSSVAYSIVIPTRNSIETIISEKYHIELVICEGLTKFQNVGDFNCFTYIAISKGDSNPLPMRRQVN